MATLKDSKYLNDSEMVSRLFLIVVHSSSPFEINQEYPKDHTEYENGVSC